LAIVLGNGLAMPRTKLGFGRFEVDESIDAAHIAIGLENETMLRQTGVGHTPDWKYALNAAGAAVWS